MFVDPVCIVRFSYFQFDQIRDQSHNNNRQRTITRTMGLKTHSITYTCAYFRTYLLIRIYVLHKFIHSSHIHHRNRRQTIWFSTSMKATTTLCTSCSSSDSRLFFCACYLKRCFRTRWHPQLVCIAQAGKTMQYTCVLLWVLWYLQSIVVTMHVCVRKWCLFVLECAHTCTHVCKCCCWARVERILSLTKCQSSLTESSIPVEAEHFTIQVERPLSILSFNFLSHARIHPHT